MIEDEESFARSSRLLAYGRESENKQEFHRSRGNKRSTTHNIWKFLGHLVDHLIPHHHPVSHCVTFGDICQHFSGPSTGKLEGVSRNTSDSCPSKYRDLCPDLVITSPMGSTSVPRVSAMSLRFPRRTLGLTLPRNSRGRYTSLDLLACSHAKDFEYQVVLLFVGHWHTGEADIWQVEGSKAICGQVRRGHRQHRS
jgi:hypothetical protein